MNVVSLGYGCVIKHQVDIYLGSKATLFFDWLITNFDSVLFVLQRIETPESFLTPQHFTCDDVYCNASEWEGAGRKVENRLTKLISVHDVHDLEDLNNVKTWHKFIGKMRRRLERIHTIIKTEAFVYFIHMVEDDTSVPSTESLSHFVHIILKFRPLDSFRLYVLFKPGFIGTQEPVIGLPVTYHQMQDTGSESNGWQMSNLNWHEFFMQLDVNSNIVRSRLDQHSSFVDKVKLRLKKIENVSVP